MERPSELPPDDMLRPPAPSPTCGIDLGVSAMIWTWLITGPFVGLIAWALVSSFAQPENDRVWMGAILTIGCALPGAAVGLLTAYGNYRLVLEQYRRANGLCIRCGYDLRAAEDRCPECGRRLPR